LPFRVPNPPEVIGKLPKTLDPAGEAEMIGDVSSIWFHMVFIHFVYLKIGGSACLIQ